MNKKYRYIATIRQHIDAGGLWTCSPASVMPYLNVSNTIPFVASAIFNGKAAWSEPGIPFNGTNKEIIVSYTPSAISCLAGKVYAVKIILTPDILSW